MTIHPPLIPVPHPGLLTAPALTAAQILPASALAPPQLGNYGVSHGSGMIGELIRSSTQSWAGHAFIYIGGGMIIEAAPPATRIAPAASHPDAVWNSAEPLTDQERLAIVTRARALLGDPYDYPAYIGFALEALHLRTGTELGPAFKRDKWRVCSADVADCYSFAGIDVTNLVLMPDGTQVPNLVSPANLYDRIAQEHWGHK